MHLVWLAFTIPLCFSSAMDIDSYSTAATMLPRRQKVASEVKDIRGLLSTKDNTGHRNYAKVHACKLLPLVVKVNWAGRCAELPAYASKVLMAMGCAFPATFTPSLVACPTAMRRPLAIRADPCSSTPSD